MVIKEIIKLTKDSDGSFIIMEDDQPQLAILDFNIYQKLVQDKQTNPKKTSQAKNILILSNSSRLNNHLKNKLSSSGHRVQVANKEEVANKKPWDKKTIAQILNAQQFDLIIYLPLLPQKNISSEEYYHDFLGGFNLLNTLKENKLNTPIIFLSCWQNDSVCATSKKLFEETLRFYHQAHNISSFILRSPQIVFPAEQYSSADPVSLFYENPIGAVLQILNGDNDCLPMPPQKEVWTQNNFNVCDYEDLLEAISFASENIDPQKCQTYQIPGVSFSLNQLMETILEHTHKMITAEKQEDTQYWIAHKDSKLPLLNDLGWTPKITELGDLIEKLYSNNTLSKNPVKQVVKSTHFPETTSRRNKTEPVSLSDLLAGNYTPFIASRDKN